MILVTGAGFIGRAVSDQFGDEALVLNQVADGPKTIVYNLTDEVGFDDLVKQLETYSITHIVHTAAITPWSGGGDYTDDLKMAENIVALCNRLQVTGLVFVSGWNVYDMTGAPPYDEQTPLGPTEPYGQSKFAVEQYLKQHLKKTALINIRTASVYGPGQRSTGLIPNLTTNALRGQPLTLDNTETRRDYVYIHDFVQAIEKITNTITKSTDVNIGSGHSYSVLEVAQTIQHATQDLTGKKVEIVTADSSKPSQPADNQLDIGLARSLGLLNEGMPFDKGIAEYIKWRQRENIL